MRVQTSSLLLYGLTIALSAFLLFQVQPIIAKIILPWFGGSAAVWTVALMFFQLTLLAGYLYTHFSFRFLGPHRQGILHMALLAASLFFLPILPSVSWKPVTEGDPTLRILTLLGATVGLPYFLLSTTSPLLQAWYVAARPGAVPYRFFALSNAGSLLALISFPIAVEPVLATRVQALSWSWAYGAFVLLCGFVAFSASRLPAQQQSASEDVATESLTPPPWRTLILWTTLPACASALMMSITTHMTQNIAPIPFLWVLTLALYLLSFILCFESERTYQRVVFIPLAVLALAAMSFANYYGAGNLHLKWSIPLFAIGLFVCCMVCHGEMARLKPHPRYLTSFYLSLAVGGAIGGLFVALAAPHIFTTYLELPVAMVVCAILIAVAWPRPIMALFVIVLTGYLAYYEVLDRTKYVTSMRNFYGVLRIVDTPEDDENTALRKLINGTINHGVQLADPSRRDSPTSYYSPNSGVGRAFSFLRGRHGSLRAGMIGLGAGVLASYCNPGDVFRFYEINPLDLAVANRFFTFLKDCRGDCRVVLGDARITLERQPPQQFDLLAVDAFSSDAIPVHLLTREAFVQYFRHLKPGGILAVHVSNRYLDLIPVVARNGEELRASELEVDDQGEDEDYYSESNWILLSPDASLFEKEIGNVAWARHPLDRPGLRTWTDDFSNLYQILK
ncbi:MAG TPA: fused MFS/spermidine synthase [Bryobacteraceae bacterium]|nr:fused MFS/spermidine synthase [Bryobacteraceae bacterium]